MSARRPLPFEIWSGAGNDFVLVESKALPPHTPRGPLARRLCAGVRGRQVDGMIVTAGHRAGLWNRDGSHPAFCGNGARCVAARMLDAEGATRVALRFGRVPLIAWREGRSVAIRVPAPRLLRRRPDAALLATALGSASAQLRDAAWIEAGVPHLCLRLAARSGRSDLAAADHATLREIGARLRRARAFGAGGTNVTFLWEPRVRGAAFEARTYERGVENLTRACGSGALAAGRLLIGGGARKRVTLRVASGARLIVERSGRGWVLRGPARRIERGGLILPAPGRLTRAKRLPWPDG